MLKKLQQKEITILVSTPYMDEAMLCNRVALMQKGKVLDIDTPQKLVENYTRKLYAIKSKDMHRLILDLRSFEKTDSAFAFGQYMHVTGKDDEVEATEFENYLLKKDHSGLEVFDIQPTIEDVFMELLQDAVV
jgi:ABC-2 type transport system ATP-binding protein